MALSGSKSISVTAYDTLKFSWSASQSVANNTSTVTWSLQLVSGSSGKIISSAVKKWSVTVAGQTFSGTNSVAIGNNTTITLASGKTDPISHNSDGTKTFSYSFSQQFDITFSGVAIGTRSGSGTGTLNTIARASTLTITDGTLGRPQTIKIDAKDNSFKHVITYTCGTATGGILGSSTISATGREVSFTPPFELAKQNTTGKSVYINIDTKTYTSGGSHIGTTSTTIKCAIPESIHPTCTVSVIRDEAGYKNNYQVALKGLSRLYIYVSPLTSYDSPIETYKVTANGATYTTQTVITDVLKDAGNIQITAKVTDKRGRSSEVATTTEQVYDYKPPKITNLTVHRCNADGTENNEGGYVLVTYSGEIDPINNLNGHVWELQYKKTTEGDDKYQKEVLNNTSYSITNGTTIFEADTEFSYDVKLVVSDNMYNANTALKPVTMTTSASTAYTIMDFGADGTSIGVGKVAEISNLFDIGFRLRTYGGILQPVLENGSDLDKLFTPNTYTLRNAITAGYNNVPADLEATASTGTLTIESCGEAGQLRQVITLCNSTNPQVYERFYYINSSGNMAWYPWKRKLEVELYNNTTGSKETISLSESAANFKYIEIFYTDNNGKSGGYTKVYSPNGQTVCLSIIEASASTYTHIRRTSYTVSEKTITPVTSTAGFAQLTGTTLSHTSGTNYIKIKRVVGYE